MIQFCVWKQLDVLHDNYDSHSHVRQDDGLLWQGDMRLGRTCRTNLLPPSPDCSLLDREIRFFQPYQFTGHHIFIRTGFLGFTNADQGLSPLQQPTHKGGTHRIQYKSVTVHDLVAENMSFKLGEVARGIFQLHNNLFFSSLHISWNYNQTVHKPLATFLPLS